MYMVKEIVRSNAHTKHDDDITAPLSSDIVNPLACLVKTVCVCYVIHHHCNCAVADVAEKQIPSYGFMSRNYQTATIKDIELISRISTDNHKSEDPPGYEAAKSFLPSSVPQL